MINKTFKWTRQIRFFFHSTTLGRLTIHRYSHRVDLWRRHHDSYHTWQQKRISQYPSFPLGNPHWGWYYRSYTWVWMSCWPCLFTCLVVCTRHENTEPIRNVRKCQRKKKGSKKKELPSSWRDDSEEWESSQRRWRAVSTKLGKLAKPSFWFAAVRRLRVGMDMYHTYRSDNLPLCMHTVWYHKPQPKKVCPAVGWAQIRQ